MKNNLEPPIILAQRIYLRTFNKRDAAFLYAIFSDPEVMRYWGSPAMKHFHDAEDYIEKARGDFQLRRSIHWGISSRSDNRLLGTVAFFNLAFQARRAEVGFALARAHWGLGYMREALQAALGYAFDGLNLHRVEADVDPRNLPSICLLDQLGFQKEGHLRERWFIPGETQDSLIYGLLAKEWNRADGVYDAATVLETPLPTQVPIPLIRRAVGLPLSRWAAMVLGMLGQ